MGIISSLFRRTKKVSLTEEEKSLCEVIEYDQRLVLEIKEVTINNVDLIPEVDNDGVILDTKDEGICSLSDYRTAFDYVSNAKDKFRIKGYLLFFFEDEDKRAFLSMLKGNDDIKIVRWRQTNGINYNKDNSNITNKLLEWKQISEYEIIGVGIDFIDLKFLQLPKDLNDFANDVYTFCSDVVDQGYGEIDVFKEELTKTRLLQLWWD